MSLVVENDAFRLYTVAPRVLLASAEDVSPIELYGFLEKDGGLYRIINLTNDIEIEETFPGRVDQYPTVVQNLIEDRTAPCPFHYLYRICQGIDAYLTIDPSNVVCLYCPDGFHMSGVILSCYLLQQNKVQNAIQALDEFIKTRGSPKIMQVDKSEGAEILVDAMHSPSFVRYVSYFEMSLLKPQTINYEYQIDSIRMITVPNLCPSLREDGCFPHITIDVLVPVEGSLQYDERDTATARPRCSEIMTVFSSLEERHFTKNGDVNAPFVESSEDSVTFPVSVPMKPVLVQGDIRLALYNNGELMGKVWFHTAFIDDNFLIFSKHVIDDIANDHFHYLFNQDFRLEIMLHRV
jgi:hypothetical protein